MRDPDRGRAKRVAKAMMMARLDIAPLEKAAGEQASILSNADFSRLPTKFPLGKKGTCGGLDMASRHCVLALASVMGLASAAQAAPGRLGPVDIDSAGNAIILVGGCHQTEENHHVAQVNRSLWHVHIGRDCAPYKVAGGRGDTGAGNYDDEDYDYEDDEDYDEDE